VDLKRVEELIDLMRRSGVTQLAVELPDYKISITRGPGPRERPVSVEMPAVEAAPAAPAAPPAETESGTGVPVVSPVVGIFHNGGMLDPREVVREGDRVHEGQLLAAIEAMKVPNEIRCPADGVVQRVLVDDGAAVEYGETLFLIQPDAGGEASDSAAEIGVA